MDMEYYKTTRKYGLISGLLMLAYLTILNLYGDYGNSTLKFMKYLILIAALIMFFSRYNPKEAAIRYIAYHIQHGAVITIYAALVTVIGNALLFLISPDMSTTKFDYIPEGTASWFMISLVLFVEVIVMGVLCTFIIFPLFKPRREDLREDDIT